MATVTGDSGRHAILQMKADSSSYLLDVAILETGV